MDGSPGLVVMGGDSCSDGLGFESQHCILDVHYFTNICCKNWYDVCLKRPKINDKTGPFKNNKGIKHIKYAVQKLLTIIP